MHRLLSVLVGILGLFIIHIAIDCIVEVRACEGLHKVDTLARYSLDQTFMLPAICTAIVQPILCQSLGSNSTCVPMVFVGYLEIYIC